MDLRQLETVLVVAQLGSLTKAALRLGIVETALSRQIRLLETELETSLFQRHGRGMIPTEAGRYLITRVRPIIDSLKQLKPELRFRQNVVLGKVSIGIPWLLFDTLSARLATDFIVNHSEVSIHFVGGVTNRLRQMLLESDLDLALLFDNRPMSEMELTPLFSERLLLIGNLASGYRMDKAVPFNHLAKVPLALPDIEEPFRKLIDALADEHGVKLNVRYEVAVQKSLLALAAQGSAQCLASLYAVRADVELGLLTAAPVERPAIVRTLMLAMSNVRPRSIALKRVALTVREVIAGLVANGSFLAIEIAGLVAGSFLAIEMQM